MHIDKGNVGFLIPLAVTTCYWIARFRYMKRTKELEQKSGWLKVFFILGYMVIFVAWAIVVGTLSYFLFFYSD